MGFSSLASCRSTWPGNRLFLPVDLARCQRSLQQTRVFYDAQLCLTLISKWTRLSNYAANAYSSFAIIVLTDVLRGQRSSSTCNPPRTLPIESGTPPVFFQAFAQRQILFQSSAQLRNVFIASEVPLFAGKNFVGFNVFGRCFADHFFR